MIGWDLLLFTNTIFTIFLETGHAPAHLNETSTTPHDYLFFFIPINISTINVRRPFLVYKPFRKTARVYLNTREVLTENWKATDGNNKRTRALSQTPPPIRIKFPLQSPTRRSSISCCIRDKTATGFSANGTTRKRTLTELQPLIEHCLAATTIIYERAVYGRKRGSSLSSHRYWQRLGCSRFFCASRKS